MFRGVVWLLCWYSCGRYMDDEGDSSDDDGCYVGTAVVDTETMRVIVMMMMMMAVMLVQLWSIHGR